MDSNMQFTINNFRQFLPDNIFPFLVKSLTAVKFSDISRFSRQVVTLPCATGTMTLPPKIRKQKIAAAKRTARPANGQQFPDSIHNTTSTGNNADVQCTSHR